MANTKRLKAVVHVSGAQDQSFYGTSRERLAAQATKALTYFEPGTGSLWPNYFEIFEHAHTLSGNRASWTLISVIHYGDIPETQHEWRQRKAKHAADRLARLAADTTY